MGLLHKTAGFVPFFYGSALAPGQLLAAFADMNLWALPENCSFARRCPQILHPNLDIENKGNQQLDSAESGKTAQNPQPRRNLIQFPKKVG
jgi:hypothetical protein